MNETLLALVATEASSRAERRLADEPDLSLEELIRECMRGSINHWMITDEEMQFKGSCVAAYNLADEDGKEDIKTALEDLRNLNALISGVPVDLDRMVANMEKHKAAGKEPPPLRKLWDDVKGEDDA